MSNAINGNQLFEASNGYDQEDVSQQSKLEYADFRSRLVASLVDGSILTVVDLLIIWLLLSLSPGIFLKSWWYYALFILTWAYFVPLTAIFQATLGKKLLGIAVTRGDGTNQSWGKIILRETIGKFISGIIFSIGFLMTLFTLKKQALHDIMADTIVVRDNSVQKVNKFLILIIFLVCIILMIFLGIKIFSMGFGIAKKSIETAVGVENNNVVIGNVIQDITTVEAVENKKAVILNNAVDAEKAIDKENNSVVENNNSTATSVKSESVSASGIVGNDVIVDCGNRKSDTKSCLFQAAIKCERAIGTLDYVVGKNSDFTVRHSISKTFKKNEKCPYVGTVIATGTKLESEYPTKEYYGKEVYCEIPNATLQKVFEDGGFEKTIKEFCSGSLVELLKKTL